MFSSILRLKLFNIYNVIGTLKKICTEITLKIVPFIEYLYVPINASGVDIKILTRLTKLNSSFLKDRM